MNNSLLIMATASTVNSATGSSGEVSIFTSIMASLFAIVVGACAIVGAWKILQKAGEDGWKAIIPFYGEYTFFKTFWEKKWFWISLVLRLLSFVSVFVLSVMLINLATSGAIVVFMVGLLPFLGAAVIDNPSTPDTVFSEFNSSFYKIISGIGGVEVWLGVSLTILALCLIFRLVLRIILNNKVSKAFGKNAGFAIGLVLLAPVFYMILGCGKAEYRKSSGNIPTKKG